MSAQVLALDDSNYTSDNLTAEKVAQLRDEAGIRAHIIQAVNPPRPYPPTKTRAQCQAVLDAGDVSLHVYIFWWMNAGTDFLKRQLDLISGFEGKIARLWCDAEDTTGGPSSVAPPLRGSGAINHGPPPPGAIQRFNRQWRPDSIQKKRGMLAGVSGQSRVDDVAGWLEVMDQYPTILGKTGIYSASWWWVPYAANSWDFSQGDGRRPIWTAEYDGVQDVDDWTYYGGWSGTAEVKQYEGTSEVLGVSGVDQNVMSQPEAVYLGQSPTEPTEPTPPDAADCSGLISALGLIGGDFMKPIANYKYKEVQKFVQKTRKVLDQFNIEHV